MGALLSRMMPVELRGEEGARAEPYNMLLETAATLRSQRALKRELYFTRAAVLALMLVVVLMLGLGVSLLFYMEFPACKDKGHDGRAHAYQDHQPPQLQLAAHDFDLKQPRSHGQNENQDDQKENVCDHKQTHSAYLRAICPDSSAEGKGNITWSEKRELVGGFTLQDRELLVVPELGMYKVSLQVTYRNLPGSKKNEPQKISLSHRALVDRQGYQTKPIVILEAFEFVYWKDDMWIKTMYSEDFIRLDKGDIIRVESDNLSFIRCRESASFLNVRHDPTGQA